MNENEHDFFIGIRCQVLGVSDQDSAGSGQVDSGQGPGGKLTLNLYFTPFLRWVKNVLTIYIFLYIL